MIHDLELARAILIEYFSTGQYNYGRGEYEVKKIKDNLIVGQEEGCFIIPLDNGHFLEGWWIEEIEEFIEQQKHYPPSVNGRVSDLNNEEKVFYEVDGQLKQFIIHEVD